MLALGPKTSSIFLDANVTQVARDIHLNGPEFGVSTASGPVSSFSNLNPGVIDTNYHYDSQATFTYLASRGYKRVKLPFRWERLQPTLSSALNAAELTRLTACLDRINTAGMKAIVDCHNYGLYYKDATPTAQPVLSASGSGSTLLAGTYTIGYSHWNGSDSSMGPTQNITITAGQNILMTANNVPSTMTSVNFWLTVAPATTNLGYLSGAGIGGGSASYTLTSKTQGSGGSAPGTGIGRRTTLGDADLPTSAFSDLWTRLATTLKTHPAIVNGGAYCIMSEPQNSGGLTVATWQTASQAAVTAIRAIDAVTALHICGFQWANCRNWTSINGAPWITDPNANLRYEAHSYFDDQVGGQYAATYAAEVANATTAGFTAGINIDAETSRIRADIKGFNDWLGLYSQRGIIGEVGWPNTPSGEQAQWNALGNVFLADADTYRIDTVAWQCGEWSIDKLTIYTGIPLSAPNSQAATIEAHPTITVRSRGGTTYTAAQVLAMLNSPSLAMQWYFDLLDEKLNWKADLTAGMDSNQPPIISYDSTRAVKRELRCRMRANAVANPLRDLIRVRFAIQAPDGGWLQWLIGVFMLTPPTKDIFEAYTWWTMTCPDTSQFLTDAAFGVATSVAAGMSYPNAIRQIVSNYGGSTPLDLQIPLPAATIAASLVWDAGASRLKAVNDLLRAVNYIPAWMNGATLVSNPYPDFNQLLPVLTLDTVNGGAQLIGPFQETADYTNAYNQVKVIGQDPRRTPIYAYAENTRPDSPVSLESWRPRLKVVNDSAIADQGTAKARAITELQLAARIYSTLNVSMPPFPFWEDLDPATLIWNSNDEGLVQRNYVITAGSHTCAAAVPTTIACQRLVAA